MVRDPLWRQIAGAALAGVLGALSGCYYVHLASGQLEINRRREPVADLLAHPETDESLRRRLEYAARARDFAMTELGLPDNGSYRTYADLGRSWVTWNLFAAPEFSVAPRRWCFPVAGCVAYRGYFDQERATRAAARQSRKGLDVHLGPSIAYSTLGHLRDPLLNTMLAYGDAELAALIFHELAHQAVYAADDSNFSEAFATVVEFEGARRWLGHLGRQQDLEKFLAARALQNRLAERMVESRERLAALYAGGADPATLRATKAEEFQRLREALAALGLANAGDINNARLAAVATYQRCVPALTAELARHDNDLPRFYDAMQQVARDPAARQSLCPGR